MVYVHGLVYTWVQAGIGLGSLRFGLGLGPRFGFGFMVGWFRVWVRCEPGTGSRVRDRLGDRDRDRLSVSLWLGLGVVSKGTWKVKS